MSGLGMMKDILDKQTGMFWERDKLWNKLQAQGLWTFAEYIAPKQPSSLILLPDNTETLALHQGIGRMGYFRVLSVGEMIDKKFYQYDVGSIIMAPRNQKNRLKIRDTLYCFIKSPDDIEMVMPNGFTP